MLILESDFAALQSTHNHGITNFVPLPWLFASGYQKQHFCLQINREHAAGNTQQSAGKQSRLQLHLLLSLQASAAAPCDRKIRFPQVILTQLWYEWSDVYVTVSVTSSQPISAYFRLPVGGESATLRLYNLENLSRRATYLFLTE